ncbi:MAG: MBL fold metallo-hydrolase [Coriobacteriales bacterium]|jgi:glyoxylase-like metal-dependent hydrolase (beta-lactamase superfamily II)|nr:MBL fold metallo-hydrolase [Coriobacteriales bacterium]
MNIETLDIPIPYAPGLITNCYIISKEADSDHVVVVDPADDAERIMKAIGDRKVDAILLTHRHTDHVGALVELANATGASVYAHKADRGHLECDMHDLKQPVKSVSGGDVLKVGGLEFNVLHTPGHTQGGICLYSDSDGVMFSGDTLFKGTCGRTDLESGSADDMHNSLARLCELPGETVVYPGHNEPTTIANEYHMGLAEY